MKDSSTSWQLVKEWQRSGCKQQPECPNCQTPTLQIEDQSVRPYSEWYHLTCRSCGLDETLQLPMRQPMGSFD